MREIRVESHWLHKGRVVLKFAQVDSIADAENLRGFEVVIPREERMPLEGDAVYVSDLLGVRVIDVSRGGAEDAGEITDVEPEAAGPAMLVVRTPAGDELLIPFVRAYLRKIDLEAKRMEMELPLGLLAMQAPLTEQERLAQPTMETSQSNGHALRHHHHLPRFLCRHLRAWRGQARDPGRFAGRQRA